MLASLDAQVEGADEFKDEELPNPLDPDGLAVKVVSYEARGEL